MVGMCQVQCRIAQYHHHLIILSTKTARQRLITDFSDDALSYVLPELSLGCPELLLILTDYECVILFSFLLVFRRFQHAFI